MIIACEKCQTRFKVGDEKFAAGPIRVRCSKCNHVFLANGPNAAGASPSPLGAPFGAGPLGPSGAFHGDVLDALIAALRQGRPSLHNARWGKATVEAALAVLRSAQERREIALIHQVAVPQGQ